MVGLVPDGMAKGLRGPVAAVLLTLGAGLAFAGEPLPSFFQQSWEVVKVHPLGTLRQASTPSPPVRPEPAIEAQAGAVPADPPPVVVASPAPPRERPLVGMRESTPVKTQDKVSLAIPASVRVRDAATFMVGSDRYRLDSVKGLVDDRCTPEGNGKCIFHPMRALKQAVAGSTLRCARMEDDGATRTLFACSK